MNVLEVKNLSIQYGETLAVKNVSFDVSNKSILSIVGESGSGKSTIIKSIMGLLPKQGKVVEGDIVFDGIHILKEEDKQFQKRRGKEMALVFQNTNSFLNPRLKIGYQFIEMLREHHKHMSKKEAEQIAKNTLQKLKLSDPERILKSYPFQLSGGMIQRVAIAFVISMNPKLIFADEPTSALDSTVQVQVVQELLKLKEELGTSIVLVTHNIAVASYISDYIAVMHRGELVEFGCRDQIIQNPQHEYTKMLLSSIPKLKEKRNDVGID